MIRPSERLNTAKRSTTSSKSATHSSADPTRGLAKKLSKISSKVPEVKPSSNSSEKITGKGTGRGKATSSQSTANSSTIALPKLKAPESKGARLVFNLLLVRPWVLVLGFWLLSLISASVAWEGMISPRKLKMALPEPVASIASAEDNSFVKVEDSAEAIADTSKVKASAEASPTEIAEPSTIAADAAQSGGLSLLPLTLFTGGCAAGCLAVARRRAMMRLSKARNRNRKVRVAMPTSASTNPARNRQPLRTTNRDSLRQRTEKQPTKRTSQKKLVKTSNSAPTAKPVKARKRRQRRKPAQAQPVRKVGSRILVSRSDAQQSSPKVRSAANRTGRAALSSRQPRQNMTQRRVASRRQPVVSVVPADQSHALDWTNGSLAHQLDVRQRSAM